ncbi:MAG: glutamine--tRNA ligase/YqeY domain fusion protein [Negativicutes bacterium]|jgi:glutaminyl-tRNA synthetase
MSDISRNFIEEIIDRDLASGKRREIVTRFPPEPNGYLHIGHSKAITINFGLAEQYHGRCNLRFDDTNPTKEDMEYVDSIKEDIKWLGFEWANVFYASSYFGKLYDCAEELIKRGAAYVCDLTADEIKQSRGTLVEPGKDSPYRQRSVEENLGLFRRMRAGEFADGARCLRAKIDMASPNMNMRDPLVYRILRASHHQTGDEWCIYPLYDYAHPLSDAFEGITHSLCSLEFEAHRPLYDWFLAALDYPVRPQQIEFARLNITRTIMSKRFLKRLVDEQHVLGWDDPRMPTICGIRRRGYPAAAVRDFCARIGVAKANSTVDMAYLEACVRENLNKTAWRAMAVLRPLKVVLTNYEEGVVELLAADNNTEDVAAGQRQIAFGRELYIEQEDFAENPPPKYHRLTPGGVVRLKHAYIIKCNEVIKNANGEISELRCEYYPESKSGQDKSGIKCKGVIHWVDANTAIDAKIRLFDYLLTERQDNEKVDFVELLNPNSMEVLEHCKVEASLAKVEQDSRYQFLRQGYFWADYDSRPGALVFNRIVNLKDGYKL